MTQKRHITLFLLILSAFILVCLSPLDYMNILSNLVHVWVIFIYGIFILANYYTNKPIGLILLAISITLFILVAFGSLFVYAANPSEKAQITRIPGRKMIIASQSYSAVGTGNPLIDISTGYQLINGFMLWRVHSYTKYGQGDLAETLSKYELPEGMEPTEDSYWFVLENDNYLFQEYYHKVYPTQKKS